jgi:exopolysaccharide biosynthesis protein
MTLLLLQYLDDTPTTPQQICSQVGKTVICFDPQLIQRGKSETQQEFVGFHANPAKKY